MMLQSIIPEPWRMASRLLAVLLVLIAIYAIGRSHGSASVQVAWDADKSRALAAQVVAEQAAREREQSMISQIRKAEHDANDREEKRRAAVAAADKSADRLRIALNAIRDSLPGNPADACCSAASASLVVFGECADALGAMAGEAGRLAGDEQKLIDAWPK